MFDCIVVVDVSLKVNFVNKSCKPLVHIMRISWGIAALEQYFDRSNGAHIHIPISIWIWVSYINDVGF